MYYHDRMYVLFRYFQFFLSVFSIHCPLIHNHIIICVDILCLFVVGKVCAGGLIGASLARNWFYKQEHRTNRNSSTSKRQQETLAYAGAAGALTAFMGIPIAGSVRVV